MSEIKNKETHFLNEYPCTYHKEYLFLKSKGFRYSFVKLIDGVTAWKYAKSAELYDALKEFYLNNK